MEQKRIAFCLLEDREEADMGVRLALLSIQRHCPNVPVIFYSPTKNEPFLKWVERFSQVRVIQNRPADSFSWNCKPHALIPVLEMGFSRAVWIDSDVIITRNCLDLLQTENDLEIIVTQEPSSLPHQGTALRTNAWGLPLGRAINITLNSAVLSVTAQHMNLLKRWRQLLGSPEYLSAQKETLEKRPVHLMSDQDILNALLGSKEFASFPIRILQSGKDIIHCGGALGYSFNERIRGLFRPKPAFLHAAAGKPWHLLGKRPHWSKQTGFARWYRELLQETSPYVAEARAYAQGTELELDWLNHRTMLGCIIRLLGLSNHALRGLPITLASSVVKQFKKFN